MKAAISTAFSHGRKPPRKALARDPGERNRQQRRDHSRAGTGWRAAPPRSSPAPRRQGGRSAAEARSARRRPPARRRSAAIGEGQTAMQQTHGGEHALHLLVADPFCSSARRALGDASRKARQRVRPENRQRQRAQRGGRRGGGEQVRQRRAAISATARRSPDAACRRGRRGRIPARIGRGVEHPARRRRTARR